MTRWKSLLASLTATDVFHALRQRLPGRPVKSDGRRGRGHVLRLSHELVDAAVETLAHEGVETTASDAITQHVRLSLSIFAGKFELMDKATREQFVREVETQIAHIMARRGALFALKLLEPHGIVARVEPSGDITVTIPRELQLPPGEITGQIDADLFKSQQPTVLH